MSRADRRPAPVRVAAVLGVLLLGACGGAAPELACAVPTERSSTPSVCRDTGQTEQ